jgi:hypothetical protein
LTGNQHVTGNQHTRANRCSAGPADAQRHGFVPATATPFLADQSIDLAGIAQNVRQFRDALGSP